VVRGGGGLGGYTGGLERKARLLAIEHPPEPSEP
jgi:O6-methylguanine-DNA--protein-cysteine methyltransferase